MTRALVLGGGGSAGNAWEIGVIAGLLDAGVDVTDADLVVGTSAGSTVAVQVMSAPSPELFTAIVEAGEGIAPRAIIEGAGRPSIVLVERANRALL